ncbi:MAG TPA: chemotaxis protein CheW [Bacillota bacterium]|jgi:purine-binding chemotaxis protein CheW|nr:chemotaxis protein CheW [Bacillota bacterium]HOB28443.1 chemotaxis protein CheW [Bacillota bacterium]HPZ41030.1 chemotaxis protein CheW [Bacillota bacterium]HQD52120.1 chemotaxis protein CheW [Bacillota bacterium]
MEQEHTEKEIQVVAFVLNNEEFACDINNVREVLKMVKVTPLPQSLKFVEGVINLRGEVIPVVDLRKRFNLPEVDYSERSRIIIVEVGSSQVGLIVDEVSEVLRLSSSQIQASPSGITGGDNELIVGVGKIEQRLLIILNLEYILSTEEQLALEDITEAGRQAVAEK